MKKTIVFILFTNILSGAGIERTVMEYIKYLPKEKFKAVVIQTDYMDAQRFDYEHLAALSDTRVITTRRKFIHNFKNPIVSYIVMFTIGPILLFSRRIEVKRILNSIDPDLVYLFGNQDSYMIPRGKWKIIGSNHAMSRKRALFQIFS